MADDATEELAKLRRQMGRALRRQDKPEFDRLAALYADLKGREVERAHRERIEAARARRAQQTATVPQEPERWRLPFRRSPMAMERDRSGIRPREEPPGPPPGGLRPWRRGWSPASQQIWRPPS